MTTVKMAMFNDILIVTLPEVRDVLRNRYILRCQTYDMMAENTYTIVLPDVGSGADIMLL